MPVSPDEPPDGSQSRSRKRNRDHQGADEDRFRVHGGMALWCRYDVKTFISAINNTVRGIANLTDAETCEGTLQPTTLSC
jgi:hypothetical protein